MANKQTIIGKTAPVPLGQQKAVNSLPVVFAEDQPPLPVEEQNKIQSEVALSLLGIPRAEVALGIFADVNTYDVNPSEWSQFPLENDVDTGTGVNHISTEAGAELVADKGRTTILTSKRFFRYQPGRVSASTMGVRMNKTKSTALVSTPNRDMMKGAPTIKKWGIFDKYDGYYFEIVNGGDANDFRCVRRTQALVPTEPSGVSATPEAWKNVTDSSGTCNIKEGNWGVVGVDPVIYRNGLCYVAAAIYDPSLCYAPNDVQAIEANPNTLSDYTFNEGYAVRLAYTTDGTNYVEHLAGRHFQFPFDQKEPGTFSANDYESWKTSNLFLKPASEYIRLDAHCRWEDLVTNLCRGNGSGFTSEIGLNSSNQLSLNNVDALEINNARMGYDTAPSEANSGVKVWNLLVNTQGSTKVTQGQFNAVFSHRTYNPASGGAGTRNLTLKEWFRLCVPKQYRTVYEWRPCRAMFSGDQLNGQTNIVRWSDVSTANVDPTEIGVKRPGDPVILDGQPLEDVSVYDIDFSKVTMWKIEFSWYGAVGALFLCYVPVAAGEARWVRVHHMRASNQLDVASLGNATLPITYMTHSGVATDNGMPNQKSILVKYGASYYIDGGDKGTVKLLSKSSDYAKNVTYGGLKTTASSVSGNSLIIPATGISQAEKDQLIGSYLKSDVTTQVIWAENSSTSIKLYFNQNLSIVGQDIELVIPRRQRALMALRAKDEVSNTTGTPIRNRIQLYPIKYGIGVVDSSSDSNILTVNFIKNPLLITNNISNTNALLQDAIDAVFYTDGTDANTKLRGFELGSGVVPKEILSGTNITSGDFSDLTGLLQNDGEYMHCYMRGLSTSSAQTGFNATTPSTQESAVLVRIFRKGSKIFIQNYSSQNLPMSVYGKPLPVRMYQFNSDGVITAFTGNFAHTKYEDQKKWNESSLVGSFESIAALSGASVSQDFKLAPVANTGNNIFSLYCNKGGDQFDLTDYFAYNKEYISYPLTNEVDILCAYAMWESTSSANQPSNKLSVVNSLTWEEQ